MTLFQQLRHRFFPRPVAKLCCQATALVESLEHTAQSQKAASARHWAAATAAATEADRANRIAVKLKELLS
jgi:hypothetical protein